MCVCVSILTSRLARWYRATKTKLVAEENLYQLMPLLYHDAHIYMAIYIYIIVDYVHEYF